MASESIADFCHTGDANTGASEGTRRCASLSGRRRLLVTRSRLRLLLSAPATLPGSGWALRTEERYVVAIVLAHELEDFVHTSAGVARERARGSPLPGGLLRIL